MNYSAEELEAIDAARRAEDWLPEDEEDESLLDDYGNPKDGSSMPYCCSPDCGCPETRLCMASNGFGVRKVWNTVQSTSQHQTEESEEEG